MSDTKNSKLSWFKLKDYAPTRGFGFTDWATMLQSRWDYEQQWPPKIDHLAPEAIKELRQHCAIRAAEFWDNYLRVVLRREYIENGRKTSHGRTLPAVEDITNLINHDDASALEPKAIFFGTRILRINTNTPDDALIQGYRQFLTQVRKFDPPPVARAGRHGLNARITDKHLESWTEYKVLAVIDLDFYAKVFGVSKLSDEVLCDLLLPPEKDVELLKDWGRAARRKAEKLKNH
jgi:hypothetical protein